MAEPTTTLSDLPVDVFQRIACLLDPRDLARFGGTCGKTRSSLLNEDVWQPVCERNFAYHTHPSRWLDGQGGQSLYRLLYPVLMQHAEYVGIWHSKPGVGYRGAVFSFRWAPAGIDVCELVPCRRFLTAISHRKFCTLGPAHPRWAAEVVDETKFILRDLGSSPASAATCAVAAAAACVAAGGASSSRGAAGDAVLSRSPGSSGFCAELLRFMQSSVQKNRSSRRSRRSGGGSELSPPVLHHFTRVLLRPTTRHPLEGVWKGLYGPHGCEMLAIRYDLSGSSARIIATKLTGDANVPAGQVSWHAAAAALPDPWPEAEQQLLARRRNLIDQSALTAAYLAEMEAADEAAGNIIAALIQQEEPPPAAMQLLQQQPPQEPQDPAGNLGLQAGLQAGGGAPGVAVAAAGVGELHMQQQEDAARIADWVVALQARRVVRVMKGRGQIAAPGFKDPAWLEGRLWVYEDPASNALSCGFLFLDNGQPMSLIDLERLDGDL